MAAARRTPREATGGLNRAPELKVHGIATVTALEICPPLADGAGEVVTGRYITRKVAATTRITLEGGAVVEGTKIHPIWSVDREDWVPLGELTVGEQLLGRDGPVRIITSEVVHKPTRVYNLEVNGEHVYQIGDLELLAHNAQSCLVKDMIAKGNPKPGTGWFAAHIFPKSGFSWAPAALDKIRKKMVDWDLIDDAANGFWTDCTRHFGTHTKKYINTLLKEFKTVKTREEAIEAINRIYEKIANGDWAK
jgi:hypothetical protein